MWEILFRHPDFVAINKPCGVSVHQEEGEVSLTQTLAAQLGLEQVWLLHRLDKLTSGVLLFALNPQSASALAQQFAAKTMRKTYLALGTDKPSKKQGWIKGDMEKSRRGTWKLMRSMENPAVTEFKNVFIVSASAVNYRHEQKNLPKRYQSRAICASPSPAGKCP